MKCNSCHAENGSGAKFCGSCGKPLEQTAGEGTAHIYEAVPAQEQKPNEKVERAKQFASNYFTFFKHVLKSPATVLKNGNVEVRNGITSLVLICFFIACIFYKMVSSTIFMATGFIEKIGGNGSDHSFKPEVKASLLGESFKMFLFLLFLFLIIGAIIFLCGKLMKSPYSFTEVLGVWGTISTPIVGLLLLTFLFSFMEIFLTLLVLGLAMICINAAIIVSIVKFDNGGLDPVYTLVISNILISIASYIVLFSYLRTILSAALGSLIDF
ncbi:zinc ribbon domain-containing protein [Bacillus pseudomycoides]|nr:zinc ribbon domain-containing protein [Bacillus pseudomycoides]